MKHSVIIGFSRPKKDNLFSTLIRKVEGWFTGGKVGFSHVYIKFQAKAIDREVVFQTNIRGAHFLEATKFYDHNILVEEYVLDFKSGADVLELFKRMVDLAGTNYGVVEILGMGVARLHRALFGSRFKNPLSDGPKTYVCSSITADVLSAANPELRDLLDDYDWEYYGPAKLHDLIVSLESGIKKL